MFLQIKRGSQITRTYKIEKKSFNLLVTLEGVDILHKQTRCLLNPEHKIEFLCVCVYMFHVQLMRMLMTCGKQLDAIKRGTAGG